MKKPKVAPLLAVQPMVNIGLLVMLWGTIALQLAYEWSRNGQYSYGLFVPFLALYLLHLRWEDRPAPSSEKRGQDWAIWALLFGVVSIQYPLSIIFEANADWRLIAWTQAAIVLLTTLVLIWRWAGARWVTHFCFPFLFLLVSIPWPRWFENSFILLLMEWVATMTVETVNFLGIYARQSGNIIMLKSGMVSIEEACSGVRSFQSTIMAALFLGELLRFVPAIRVGIVLAGAVFAIFFNFCRTLALTLISASRGAEVMEKWHDPAGYMVFFFALAALGLLCYLIRLKTHRRRYKPSFSGVPFSTQIAWLPVKPVAVLLVLLLLTEPLTLLWYSLRGPDSQKNVSWTVDWEEGTQDLQFEEIQPRIQETLFYNTGEMVTWETPNQYHWVAYYFTWNSGKAAQLGGVHNPELCLPAVGWTLLENPEDMLWQGPDELELIFNSYYFESQGRGVYVFYCQWDPQGYPYHTKEGRFRLDRLHDAWIGDRKEGKQKLEIIIEGPTNMAQAKKALEHFLDQSIMVNGQSRAGTS